MEARTSPIENTQTTPPAAESAQRAGRMDEAATGAAVAQHCIMFWVLTMLAMAVFAPCVLAPIYAETEQILETERQLERWMADKTAEVKRNDERIKAIKADPQVNERIIRRELNYRFEGEQLIQWSSAELAAMHVDLSLLENPQDPLPPVNPYPAWVLKLGEWLPAWPWRKLFVESPNRELLVIMAAGLLATAFLLYGPLPPVTIRDRETR
jgi:hypothetical protein